MHDGWVYILKCSDNSYYTGVTNNVERRFAEHQGGDNKKCYTYSRRPVELLWCDHFGTILEAIAIEKQIKGWRREKKEALIAGRYDLLPALAKSKKKIKDSHIEPVEM